MLAQQGKAVRRAKPRACKVCGCTDNYACDEGCEWVCGGLCSACLNRAIGVLEFFAKSGDTEAEQMLRSPLKFLRRLSPKRLTGLPL